MENLRLGALLHFFQPYWQFPHVIKMVADQCYRPIFKFVKNHPDKFSFTASINYSLIELLKKNDCEDVLDDIRFAVGNNLIELVGTGAHHPIIPLLPEKEIGKQISYDIQQKKFLGIVQNSKGFFFPEMAFSNKCLPVLRQFDYSWTVIEDVAVLPSQVPLNYIISNQGILIFLRSSHWSRYIWDNHMDFGSFAGKINYEMPSWARGGSHYLVIAMDAETFGHHVPGLSENFLFPLIENWGSRTVVPFEYLRNIFRHQEIGEIKDCSWSSDYDDLYNNDPYPLWNDPRNGHHFNLWKLVGLALKYADNPEAIVSCLKMVNSCHWWWISRGFWNPHFMITGAKSAFDVVNLFGTDEEKKEAAIYFNALSSLL